MIRCGPCPPLPGGRPGRRRAPRSPARAPRLPSGAAPAPQTHDPQRLPNDRTAAPPGEALCAARSDRRTGPVVRLFARPLLRPREFETKGAFVNRRLGPCGVARRRAARSTALRIPNGKVYAMEPVLIFLTILVFRIGSDWMHRIRLPCAVSMLNPCQPAERQRRRAGVMQATDKATNAQRHDFGRRIARPRDGSLFSACSFRSE